MAGPDLQHPDLDWLGLEHRGEGRWTFELTDPISRLDAKFYGGTGVAVTTAVMEAQTRRTTLWTTVQFVASADVGERFDVEVDLPAHGHVTSQVLVRGSVGDRLVFTAVGSTGELREGKLDAQFGDMPDVPSPEDTPEFAWRPPFPLPPGRPGWLAITEMRSVERTDGKFALWARMEDRPQTRASIGFLADVVPMGVFRAAGRAGGGQSLDNAVRFGPVPETDWILIDLDPHMANGGYVHGAARIWAPDGTLLAIASQTGTARFFD